MTCIYLGQELAAYGFGDDHPFGPQRHQVFQQALEFQGLLEALSVIKPVQASKQQIELFHTAEYVEQVIVQSKTGQGYLDYGDTPAFKGVYEAASYVVGSVLDAVDRLLDGQCLSAFVPIAGLHHAKRNRAAGFCVFNDCGIAIEYLKQKGLSQILYVDIDAHHGDGVFYGFEDDSSLIFVDIHESGDYLYPGTGDVTETGQGAAEGMKLNIPMPPGADDEDFYRVWAMVESFLQQFQPQFIILQAGADSLAGDPITHLQYSATVHRFVARALIARAARYTCPMLALGGGGYNHENIAAGWTAVVTAMLDNQN
ncbi:MAG: acetoin utilization protein AcuC [Gammaproteobacteria bacterium]|nr:acetoin utilization protein AcuC [Gammaproteobacteria bacterium]